MTLKTIPSFALLTMTLFTGSVRSQETAAIISVSTTVSKPDHDPDNKIVREFLSQMEKLSDDEIQAAAEKLSQRLLGELKYGPAIEQMKHRRASMHRLRGSLQSDLDLIDAWLVRTRDRLSSHVSQLREAESVDGAVNETRIRILVEANAQAIRASQQRAATLKSQIEQVNKQIEHCVVQEKLASDGLVLSSAIQPGTFALSELPQPTSSIWFELPDTGISSPSDTNVANDPRSLDKILAELGVK